MTLNLGNYQSVPEFIYGITREIWEDRGLGGKLDKYYAPDILLRAPTGFTSSNQGVVAQTLQTLHQFPDRQLVGEDVIWRDCGDGTFLSSHRLTSVMTHTGDGSFGPASGRPVRSRIIAECWVRDQVVIEEWLVRDQAAFASCLGVQAKELARKLTDRELQAGQPVSFFTPRHDQPSRYPAAIDPNPVAVAYCAAMRRIWEAKDTAAIRDLYFHGADLHTPGGDVRYGHSEIDRFVIGYLASIPDAGLQIESAIVNREPERPIRLALRWSLTGTHSGFGHFGEPTGAPLYIMGLSHVHMTGGKVMSEWLLVDEVSIWKQIFAHQAGQLAA
jgi:SnoaL-like polyketide cyclase